MVPLHSRDLRHLSRRFQEIPAGDSPGRFAFRGSAPPVFRSFFYKTRADASGKLRAKIIDAITTNETSFFRDTAPFELLRHKLIPELIDRRNGNAARLPIRIWSAACSTGQEAYSTAIVFKEQLGDLTRYDIRILGTDISDKAVAQASYGEYRPPGTGARFAADRCSPGTSPYPETDGRSATRSAPWPPSAP